MSREAMKLALDALENHTAIKHPQQRYYRDRAIDALRAALDAPEPTIKFLDPNAWKVGNPDTEPISVFSKPVWIQSNHLDQARREPSMCRVEPTQRLPDFVPLYTAPIASELNPEALEEMEIDLPNPKPVAYADSRIHGWPECFVMEPDPPHTVPLYAAPREWVGLPDMEVYDLADEHLYGGKNYGILSFYKAIEAKLKEKNT